jgi:glycerol-3-phosphate dehydrogenase (NAD(P)+)
MPLAPLHLTATLQEKRMPLDHIAVIGAGAWGAALANVCARAGRAVTLAARDAPSAMAIKASRKTPRLPGLSLDERIDVTASLDDIARADAVLLAVPAQALRAAATTLAPALKAGTPVVACAKGIERGTGKFMTEVIAECLPRAVPAILSGPSFAADVARGLPTAVTLAAREEKTAAGLAHALGSATFRPYHATDVRGVEIGGAAKNVLAIAAGIVAGRGLGASAAAALTTRGFAELVRFGKAFGARAETLGGLSGLGDLILTCATPQSRNFSLGVALGKGAEHEGKLAEGAFTASVLVDMAAQRGVDMPIATAVAAILDGKLGIDAAIESLLTRPFKAEA